MKKTLTINLSGVVWTINDDAYLLLKNYLDELEASFSSDDEKEILCDIEARISELFAERLGKRRNVVEAADVEYVISVLGRVSDFSEADTAANNSDKKHSRRFYRDPDNKIVGGVAAGLAAYFGWNLTAMRVIFVVLGVLFFQYTLPIYLIVWLVTSEAKTSAQKLEMYGDDVTVDNIKNIKTRLEENMPDASKVQSLGARTVRLLGQVFKWCVIILGGFIGICVASTCILSILALLIALVAFIALPAEFPELMTPWTMLLYVSLLLFCLLPLIGSIWLIVRLLSKKSSTKNRSWLAWSMFVVWIISIFTMIFSVLKLAPSTETHSIIRNFVVDDSGMYISEPRQVGAFNAVSVSHAVNVNLATSDTCRVRVKANTFQLSNIKTEVKDSILYIYSLGERTGRAEVDVALPCLRMLDIESASNVEGTNLRVAPTFEITANSASKAELELLPTETVSVHVGEASKVELSGVADSLFLRVNGASKADLADLRVRKADVQVRAASMAEVWASDALYYDVQGASKFEYKGMPRLSGKSEDFSSVVADKD